MCELQTVLQREWDKKNTGSRFKFKHIHEILGVSKSLPSLVPRPCAGRGSGHETSPHLQKQLILGDALDGLDEVGVEGEDEAQFQLDALWEHVRQHDA